MPRLIVWSILCVFIFVISPTLAVSNWKLYYERWNIWRKLSLNLSTNVLRPVPPLDTFHVDINLEVFAHQLHLIEAGANTNRELRLYARLIYRSRWMDGRFSWRKSTAPHVKWLLVPRSLVYRPVIRTGNNMLEAKVDYHARKKRTVSLSQNGTVEMIHEEQFMTHCEFDKDSIHAKCTLSISSPISFKYDSHLNVICKHNRCFYLPVHLNALNLGSDNWHFETYKIRQFLMANKKSAGLEIDMIFKRKFSSQYFPFKQAPILLTVLLLLNTILPSKSHNKRITLSFLSISILMCLLMLIENRPEIRQNSQSGHNYNLITIYQTILGLNLIWMIWNCVAMNIHLWYYSSNGTSTLVQSVAAFLHSHFSQNTWAKAFGDTLLATRWDVTGFVQFVLSVFTVTVITILFIEAEAIQKFWLN